MSEGASAARSSFWTQDLRSWPAWLRATSVCLFAAVETFFVYKTLSIYGIHPFLHLGQYIGVGTLGGWAIFAVWLASLLALALFALRYLFGNGSKRTWLLTPLLVSTVFGDPNQFFRHSVEDARAMLGVSLALWIGFYFIGMWAEAIDRKKVQTET
jgi:hypothetical protein